MKQRALVDLSADSLTAEQRLACAVLRLAILDVCQAAAPTGDAHQQAAEWFRESDDGFRFWCEVAGVDPEVIRARLQLAG
jgi:hypothetical protein